MKTRAILMTALMLSPALGVAAKKITYTCPASIWAEVKTPPSWDAAPMQREGTFQNKVLSGKQLDCYYKLAGGSDVQNWISEVFDKASACVDSGTDKVTCTLP